MLEREDDESEEGGIPDGRGGFLWFGGNGGGKPSTVTNDKECLTCMEVLRDKAVDELIDMIPVVGCRINAARCAKDEVDKAASGQLPDLDSFSCLADGLECVAEAEEMISCASGGGIGLAICEGAKILKNLYDIWKDLSKCMGFEWRPDSRMRVSGDSHLSFAQAMDEKNVIIMGQIESLLGYYGELFGDESWLEVNNYDLWSLLRAMTSRKSALSINELAEYKPENISEEQFATFINRVNNSFFSENTTGGSIDFTKIKAFIDDIVGTEESINQQGYSSTADMWISEYRKYQEILREGTSSVCASVSLEINQTLTMTRPAYRGTLKVFNGHDETAMTDVRLDLIVKDEDGNVATAHEFQINAESFEGFGGEMSLGEAWTLDAQQTGKATVLFIPTKYAAQTGPKKYSFGGTLNYIDPFTGLEKSMSLIPVQLTVNPLPDLELSYLMQRDIYGDDPLTEDILEPMEEAEFALIINNKGYGDANKVRMVTEQPKIIENEKDLLINFEIVSSQVNGEPAALSLGQAIANDFGTIGAHSQAYAQWWLRSTLLGHFTSYEVEATHVTNYGNADLSLVNTVTIHEMIHGFTPMVYGQHSMDNVKRGWLVNDIVDADDMPDVVYFTDASQQDLYIAQNGKIDRFSENEYLLNVMPSQVGWNYGSVTDPTYGRQKLTKIVRKSDGVEIPVDNIWQTDRTLRDGRDWLYENRLHFVGNMSADGETFILTFEPIPELELAVESYAGIPEKGSVLKEQLTELTVKFNKPIKAESFTTEDITLNCEGVKQDASQIVIEKQSEQEYKLILNEVTLGDGYYVLTVQTADIEDNEGFNGSTSKQATWIQFVDGKVALKVTASPTEGGTVTPSSGRYDYDSEVTLTATPTDGYTFSSWKQGDNVLSSDNVITYHVVANTTLTAQFTINHYAVIVDYDASAGTVDGYGTGIYDHGTQLHFVAVPAKDYLFSCWTVNGEKVTGNTLTLTVTGPLDIRAEFIRDIYEQTFTLTKGWNWMSSYLSEPINVTALSVYANRIVGQFDEMIRDPQFGLVGGFWQLTTGEAYKVEALTRFSTSFRGHLFDVTQNPINMKKGWNWVAYPWPEERLVSITIPDAEEGDYIVSQSGFSEFADGCWEGNLRKLTPGEGYLYKSYSDKTLSYDFTNVPADSRTDQFTVHNPQFTVDVIDVNRYPNTMNVTARIYQDDMELTGDNYLLYAMNGNELRGIGEYVGSNYYLTVYGDLPLDINFMVVDAATGETFVANEHIMFRDDVVGSRKQPFAISIGKTTGIADIEQSTLNMDNWIYDLQGRKIGAEANSSLFTIHSSLRKGVYIVNGHKVINGKYINK